MPGSPGSLLGEGGRRYSRPWFILSKMYNTQLGLLGFPLVFCHDPFRYDAWDSALLHSESRAYVGVHVDVCVGFPSYSSL